MLINEFTNIIDEYRVIDDLNPDEIEDDLADGDFYKNDMTVIRNSPLPMFTVRYRKDGGYHDYYLFNKSEDKCVGIFSIETVKFLFLNKILVPGIQSVTPHMTLDISVQRQGIASQAYSSFLRGGPWVFCTTYHTDPASKLWNSMVKGDVVSRYVDTDNGQILSAPSNHFCARVIGPRNRFRT